MSKEKKDTNFSSAFDGVEEKYIRSGGKDPYVLTLLTRAHGDVKEKKDNNRNRDLAKNYDSIKRRLIRQYNDVELENVKLQTELYSIQQQLNGEMSKERLRSSVHVQSNQNVISQSSPMHSPSAQEQFRKWTEFQPSVTHNSTSNPPGIKPAQTQLNIDISSNDQKLDAFYPQMIPDYLNTDLLQMLQQSLSIPPGTNFQRENPFVMGGNQPYGNTYIVTGDEVRINDNEDRRCCCDCQVLTNAQEPQPQQAPQPPQQSIQPVTYTYTQQLGKQLSESPVIGIDAGANWERQENTDESFYINNQVVPQGLYDQKHGILVFFDLATNLPKEARFCRLSVALVSSGKMKPPLSFPALETEQFPPGDHPEIRHFTTVCTFVFSMVVTGGQLDNSLHKRGLHLVAEVLTSVDKPIDDQAPVLGWSRLGWIPITLTKSSLDGLATSAGRYRTYLRKALPLAKDNEGLLALISESKQEIVPNRTELFYRIVNTQQSARERSGPVNVKYLHFYNKV